MAMTERGVPRLFELEAEGSARVPNSRSRTQGKGSYNVVAAEGRAGEFRDSRVIPGVESRLGSYGCIGIVASVRVRSRALYCLSELE